MTFRQDPALSSDEYVFEGDDLTIIAKAMGLKREKMIKVSEIDPNIEIDRRRFAHLYIIPTLLAGIMLYITWVLSKQEKDISIIALFPGIFAIVLIYYAVKGATAIEVRRFRNRQGIVLFEIYRPRKSRLAYEDFVSALCTAVRESAPTNSRAVARATKN